MALDRLLQHTRRGSLQVLWDTALAEVEARLSHCEDTPTGMQSSEDRWTCLKFRKFRYHEDLHSPYEGSEPFVCVPPTS